MISKYEAWQEQIGNQPALGQQKLKAMLRFLENGQVSQSELEKVLTYDYKGKTEEQSELYTTLVGLVIDLYIKNNGQENFLELYNSLQGEKVEQQPEPVEEKKEDDVAIIVPEHTERTPKAVAPRKKMKLASPEPIEKTQELVVAPIENTEQGVSEELKKLEETEEPEEELTNISEESEEEDIKQEEELEERKMSGIVKYLAIGIPTVLAIGGLAFWQVNTNNKNTSLAEQEVVKILEEAPKEPEKGAGLSSGEFDSNVKALTTGYDTIKQSDKAGLSGYFVFEGKRYFIQKYDQNTGTLTVFNTKGEKVVYDDAWVQKFIGTSKAKAKKTENKNEEKPKSDSKEVQTKSSNLTSKKEGSN